MRSILLIPKLLCLLLLLMFNAASAQTPSLSEQYHEVVTKAGSYRGYKHVQATQMEALWKNSMDSLASERQKALSAQSGLQAMTDSLQSLRAELNEVQESSEAAQNPMEFVGVQMDQGTWNTVSLVMILVLLILAVILFLRSNAAVKEARYRTELYNDLSEELKEHKVRANEREKKLARELQTERNLVAELQGRQ